MVLVSSIVSEAMAVHSCFFTDLMCCPNVFQGENLDLAISKDEVMAMIGEGICVVKTLTRNHLYCEPPSEQPAPRHRTKREGTDLLPEFTVGNCSTARNPVTSRSMCKKWEWDVKLRKVQAVGQLF